MTPARPSFDPRGVLTALEREYVAYVLIGGLARVLRGTDETTGGVDVWSFAARREPAATGTRARHARCRRLSA